MTPPAWLGSHWLSAIYIKWLLDGALATLFLALCVCIAATILGMLFTVLRTSKWYPMSLSTQILLSLHRNTPLMVQLLLWYFGFSSLLPETMMEWLNEPHCLMLPLNLYLKWPSFEMLAAFVSLTVYSASFITGELCAGLRGVDKEQRSAAYALGMRSWQVFYWVVLPQAFVIVRRPLIGQYTAVIKNTSLAMVIGTAELSYRTRQVETETLLAFQTFAVTTLLYLIMILFLQYKGNQKQATWEIPR